jgi:hypothetical protein
VDPRILSGSALNNVRVFCGTEISRYLALQKVSCGESPRSSTWDRARRPFFLAFSQSNDVPGGKFLYPVFPHAYPGLWGFHKRGEKTWDRVGTFEQLCSSRRQEYLQLGDIYSLAIPHVRRCLPHASLLSHISMSSVRPRGRVTSDHRRR